jgi:hypothetical protein
MGLSGEQGEIGADCPEGGGALAVEGGGFVAGLGGLSLGARGLGVEVGEEAGGVAAVANFGKAGVVALDGRELGIGEEAHLAPPFLRISDDKQTMFVRGSGAPQSAAS